MSRALRIAVRALTAATAICVIGALGDEIEALTDRVRALEGREFR